MKSLIIAGVLGLALGAIAAGYYGAKNGK
jgi:hypothetical protein